MSKEIEDKLEKIPIINLLVRFGKKIKIPGLEGMSLYDVLEMYVIGIIQGALTTRAGGIAFSFFMAVFPFMLFILLSCIFWGISVTIVKHLSSTDSTISIVAWMSIFLTLLSLPLAIFNWQTPTYDQLLILGIMGILGTLGHLGMAKALSLAETTAVMSIDFFRLVWSAMIGVYFFGDGIAMTTWIGALIIFCSGIYIIFRESISKQSPSP